MSDQPDDPTTIAEAMACQWSLEWQRAIDEELRSLSLKYTLPTDAWRTKEPDRVDVAEDADQAEREQDSVDVTKDADQEPDCVDVAEDADQQEEGARPCRRRRGCRPTGEESPTVSTSHADQLEEKPDCADVAKTGQPEKEPEKEPMSHPTDFRPG